MLLHLCITRCEEARTLSNLNKADKHRVDAQNYLRILRPQIDMFENELRKLPKPLSQTKLVLTLRKIPVCVDALKQSFGTVPNSQDFQNGLLLATKISDWLLSALHRADQILEAHFQEMNRTAK
jgi:hypothetical protein